MAGKRGKIVSKPVAETKNQIKERGGGRRRPASEDRLGLVLIKSWGRHPPIIPHHGNKVFFGMEPAFRG